MSGETVAIEVDDVDVGSTQSVALFENAGAFVDQGVEAAIGDFFGTDLALRCAGFAYPFLNERSHFRIIYRTPIFVVLVPTRAGFLSEAALFAKIIFREGLANSWFFKMAIFL